MASLKEILPLLLAGGAGAASPQGADVFNNILRQKRVGEQQERQERESEQRFTLAQRASDRAERSEERAVKNQEGVISIRQMRMDQINKQNAETDRVAAGEKIRKDYLIGEHPELVAIGSIDERMTQKQVEAVIKSEDKRNPDWEESKERALELKALDLSGSFRTDQGTIGTGPTPRQGKVEEPLPPFTETMLMRIKQDAAPGIAKAEEQFRQSQLEYHLAKSGQGMEEVTEIGLESLRQKMEADRAGVASAQEAIPVAMLEQNASPEDVQEYLNPSQGDPGFEPVSSHAPITMREKFFLANPDKRGAPGFGG